MITLFELQEIIESQQQRLKRIGNGMLRAISIRPITTTHTLIISGINS
jgi:hypothetical protein